MDRNILIIHRLQDSDWEQLKDSIYKRRKFSVREVFTIRESIKLIRNEPIHIVIADYDLPRDAIKFLKKIKSLKPFVEVIFLATEVTMTKGITAMREGAYDFYEFPVNNRLLMAVINKALEKQSLYLEKTELEQCLQDRFDFSNIIGKSKAMQHVLRIVSSVSQKNVSILITGETGTGKELIASVIHYNSPRSDKALIKVNCAAFNEGVLESELFGHEKGAFTGAIATRLGRFELADGGTIFIDEVGDLSPNIQIKLLRVLQEREFESVGSNETKKVDIRVIAATNSDLRKLIEERKFREDLFYRLNVVNIEMPPLRERTEDIPLLVSYFINKLNQEKDFHIKGISNEAMRILLNYRWPGNVRELENAIESAMALTEGSIIDSKYLPSFLLLSPPDLKDFYHISKELTLHEMEKRIIELTLERTGGNKTRAAKLLNIGLRTLQRKV
jgi:DNA-binding NtrC family response regulator